MRDVRFASGDGAWRRGILRAGPPGPAIVLKFGGSLLARADWPDLLRSIAESCGNTPVSIVVGGGQAVDSIRRIDAAAGLDAAISHRLAIDAMGITARLTADSTGWTVTGDVPGPESPSVISPRVIDVPAWLDVDGRFARLPAGWHVTSDSIAAFIAAETGSNLLLAKSVPPPHAASADSTNGWVDGWVDDWFETAAAGIGRIEWAAPVSPTTSRRSAGRRARRHAASRPQGPRPSSRRPPTAG